MQSPEFITSGAYGCIFYPSIPCNGEEKSHKDKKYISKFDSEVVINSVATPEMVKVLLDKLKEKNIKS